MDLLQTAIKASVEAGKAIMNIYESGDFGVEMKSDNSPLTLADKAAHDIISERLKATDVPILSEEGKHESYDKRKGWKKLWIVDPLDGTKEFVKKTGEFTVNIALIENGFPLLGVVFVPVSGVVYYGDKDGAFKVTLKEDWKDVNYSNEMYSYKEQINCENLNPELTIVASVSHLSKETQLFADMLTDSFKDTNFISKGSSLKICMIAEGKADIYPRLGPTMEWDTAAGQAVAECAGAHFINWKTLQRFNYNREVLLNDWFVVCGTKISFEELKVMISSFEI